MIVLSLFDGGRTGKKCLNDALINVDKYYSSEIDPWAIKVGDKNHPETIPYKLGDVTKWRGWNIDWISIDLIIAGSPCQGFSIAGKQLNFKDPRSKLYFEFEDILKYVKSVNPKVKFLLENVRMKKEYSDIISKRLGIEPILINSSLVSAQDRKRLYWTNISDHIKQPKDKGIMLNEILEEEVDSKFYISTEKAITICDKEVKRRKIGYIGKDSQGQRIYNIHGKSVCISALGGGWGAKTGLYWIPCITPDRVNKRQNGRRFKPSNAKFYTLTASDRHGILTKGQIRKLTPIECERLQTLPNNYTLVDGITDNERIKICGNGWTADVITHILRYLKLEEK